MRHPIHDERYKNVPADVLPKSESLRLTIERVLPYWHDEICPKVKAGKNIIIVAHGNSLRAIVKHLSKMNEEEIIKYYIPTACPLVYEFNDKL